MVNTRKENRITKLQRNKKKNYSKKIYGGKTLANQLTNKVTNSIPNVNNLQDQLTNKVTNVIPNVNNLQDQLTNKVTNVIPNVNNLQDQLTNKVTNAIPNVNNLQDQMNSKIIPQDKNVFSNLMSVGAQIANKGINYGLNTISKLTGTNPNLSLEESVNALKNKAQNIANVISNTDLGNQLGKELSQATNKILGPAVEKGSNIINKLAEKEEKAVVGLGANLAEDIAYPIVAPIRTALSGLQVIENSTEAASEATGVLKEQVEAYNEVKDKIGKTLEEISDIASKNIVPEITNPELPSSESISQDNNSKELSEQSLKQINKEGSMIGGRIRKSQLDFLKPFINSSKILKQLGGKLRTKKRNIIKRKISVSRR